MKSVINSTSRFICAIFFFKTRKCHGRLIYWSNYVFRVSLEHCLKILNILLFYSPLHKQKSMFLRQKSKTGWLMLHLCLSALTRVHARLRAHPSLSSNTSILCPTAPRMGKSESQMDIMEKSTKPRKHRWTVVEIGLSVVVLLMSCALAGLIVLYTSALRGGHFCCTSGLFRMLCIQTNMFKIFVIH